MTREATTLYCGDNCNHTGPHRFPPTEWHPAIASGVANHYIAQSQFYVQQAEAMGVLLFKIIRALGLPPDASPTTDDDPLLFGSWRASRVLASLTTTPVSDDTEGAG